MMCDVCNNQGIALECKCRFDVDENCDTCDGCGYIDCPYLDKGWHK